MKIENNISEFIGTSATKAIIPALALSIPYFFLVIALINLCPYVVTIGGPTYKAIPFAALLMGIITSFTWVLIKNVTTYPKSVIFEKTRSRYVTVLVQTMNTESKILQA